MRKIDYVYKNFDPEAFSKNIKGLKVSRTAKSIYFLTYIVLNSIRDIDQIKNEINLHEFTSLGENNIFFNFIKKYKNNYNDKNIENYFFKKHNILNSSNEDYSDLESLLQQHVNSGEFFRHFRKSFEIIFYAQVTYKDHTHRGDNFGMYRDYYCLHIKNINKYYLFFFEYEDDGNDYSDIVKNFNKRPNKKDIIKLLKSGDYDMDLIKKEEIRVTEYKIFNYDKAYNRIFSEGYKLEHKIEPHFTNEEDYFDYHNEKNNEYIAGYFLYSNPEKYFKKFFKKRKNIHEYLKPHQIHKYFQTKSGKLIGKVKDNNLFKYVMSDKFNYRNDKKLIEKILYSYDDLEGFLKYIPKKIQESKTFAEEIRILRLFRGKNKKFIVKVFQTNKDKLEDLAKNYMPSTIFDDPYLMIELIKLDTNFSADIGNKLNNNKKFMKKVKKIIG